MNAKTHLLPNECVNVTSTRRSSFSCEKLISRRDAMASNNKNDATRHATITNQDPEEFHLHYELHHCLDCEWVLPENANTHTHTHTLQCIVWHTKHTVFFNVYNPYVCTITCASHGVVAYPTTAFMRYKANTHTHTRTLVKECDWSRKKRSKDMYIRCLSSLSLSLSLCVCVCVCLISQSVCLCANQKLQN